MSKLIIDERLRSELNGLNAEMEICDESGRTLGHFVPADLYKKMLYAWLGEPPFTPEEMERILRQQGPGRSTAEVSKRLGAT